MHPHSLYISFIFASLRREINDFSSPEILSPPPLISNGRPLNSIVASPPSYCRSFIHSSTLHSVLHLFTQTLSSPNILTSFAMGLYLFFSIQCDLIINHIAVKRNPCIILGHGFWEVPWTDERHHWQYITQWLLLYFKEIFSVVNF